MRKSAKLKSTYLDNFVRFDLIGRQLDPRKNNNGDLPGVPKKSFYPRNRDPYYAKKGKVRNSKDKNITTTASIYHEDRDQNTAAGETIDLRPESCLSTQRQSIEAPSRVECVKLVRTIKPPQIDLRESYPQTARRGYKNITITTFRDMPGENSAKAEAPAINVYDQRIKDDKRMRNSMPKRKINC